MSVDETPFTDKMSDAKRAKMSERRQTIVRMADNFGGTRADFVDYLAEHFDCSERTIERDLAALQEAGRLYVNGKVEVLS